MTTDESRMIEQKIRIAASPETIFPYFTDPEKMLQWKGIEATLDPQPGGIYQVNMNGRNIARGEYLEVTPYSRVVFTWGWEEKGSAVPPGSTTVEITLTPDDIETVVCLRHTGLPAELEDVHDEGWKHYLPRLVAAAEGTDPGPDPWIRAGQELE